ncbi:Fis family transcriptional regulator [Leptothrix sp. C29]|uniref:Putative Fis-like DNA-binding protein n=1 Tax=Sphaerotilus uruguayifluvii TaxID=2735897 RepID=A0ABX2G541_9BURK|nr:Fis family transcriptional regulator [Leptothrix sp. C29]
MNPMNDMSISALTSLTAALAVDAADAVAAEPPAATPAGSPIDQSIRATLETYFDDLDGTTPHGLYDMVIKAVERPLLDVVMARADGNQSRAAEWLGINRNTLRRKLVEHRLID